MLTAVLCWIAAFASPAARAAATPADVRALEKRVKACNALAAEPPTDEKKVLALQAELKKSGCEEIETIEKKLRWKYRNRLKILDLIEKITAEEP